MTEKRFAVTQTVLGSGIYDFQAENELCESYDEDAYSKVVKKLNELHEENQLIKKHIGELYKFVKIDVDNEREVYPKALLGGIVDILKIIGDLE